MLRSSARITVAAVAAVISVASLASFAGAQQPAPRPPARDSMRRDMSRDMNHDMRHDMGGPERMGPRSDGMRGPAGPGGGMGAMPGGVASMLLAQTAALKLNDQQVTRLAALARSAESQQSVVRASMDSMHRAMMGAATGAGRPGGATPPPQMTPAMEARMRAVHDQMHANTRDALAVLTPDQLASAWETRGGMGGGTRGGPARGGPRPR